MPLKQLDAPCAVIAGPDGTPAGQWEERHFSDEDEAADILDCEREGDPGLASVTPQVLASPCLTIVCDGCGEPYAAWPDDHMIAHFASRADAVRDADGIEFRADGTTRHEDCRDKTRKADR
jgi:hypothetical protein